MRSPAYVASYVAVAVAVGVLATASPAQQKAGAPSLAEIEQVLRVAATEIEARYGLEHPEAAGLVQRVETWLTATPPRRGAVDRRQAMADRMPLATFRASFESTFGGIRGYRFDASESGLAQRSRDLESQRRRDGEDVHAWIELRDIAARRGRSRKRHFYRDRAIAAARSLVAREPREPDSYALLAAALEWQGASRRETFAALDAALLLDPSHPLASALLLERKIGRLLESVVLHRTVDLEAPAMPRWLLGLRLAGGSFSPDEIADARKRSTELGRAVDRVLDGALEKRDRATFFRCIRLSSDLRSLALAWAEIPAGRTPAEATSSSDELPFLELAMLPFPGDVPLLHAALDLAGDDAEAVGTLALHWVYSEFVRVALRRRRPRESSLLALARLEERLSTLASAGDGPNATSACEALAGLDLLLTTANGREPRHAELLLRAVRERPSSQRVLRMLLGAAIGRGSAPATAAAAELELAVLPNVESHRLCAATAARMHDWERAFEHLDAGAEEAPRDLRLRHQRIVTTLRRSQDAGALESAARLYGDITATTVLEDTADLGREDRRDFVEAFILYLALRGDGADAARLFELAQQAEVLAAEEARELGRWLR